MARRRIPIDRLQIGMYVAKLDLAWFRSPFLRHSFLIEQASQIERLARAGVKTVEIDPGRGNAACSSAAQENLDDLPQAEGETKPPVRSQPVKSLAQLNEEYAQAKLARQQLDQAVHSLFAALTETGTVAPEQAAEAVQEITIVARTLPPSAMFMALSLNRGGDASLSRHALAVCTLALVLGQSFQLNPLELNELATAALLHDIGLLQIPPALLLRAHVTSTPLSPQEERRFHAHPRLGRQTLERQGKFDPPVLRLVEHHHAGQSDGGAPAPASMPSLSERAEMLRVVDRYDELIVGFGGATPLTPQQALQRLYLDAQQSGRDQTILARFIEVVGIYPVHSCVRLNTKELAVVTALNPDRLHQPVVTLTHQPDSTAYPSPLVLDLARQDESNPPRAIESILDNPPTSPAFNTSHAA